MGITYYCQSPIGLLIGLISVLTVHFTLVLPYYYCLRTGFIRRPLLQTGTKTYENTFLHDVRKHLLNPEGLMLLGGYLSITWIFGLMPQSYYVVWDSKTSFLDILLQLMINDLYQTIAHMAEHKFRTVYRYAHELHHRHKSPMLLDAFDGHLMDTILMILVPLYSTSLTLAYIFQRHISLWSYVIFGTVYANYLCLIHSEYEHPWDILLAKIGVCTPKTHHLHHKLFHRNFGHIFTYWDRLFGTYTSG